MAKPWENNSGCNDFTAYRALKAVEEEEQRVADFIRSIKTLARLSGLEIIGCRSLSKRQATLIDGGRE